MKNLHFFKENQKKSWIKNKNCELHKTIWMLTKQFVKIVYEEGKVYYLKKYIKFFITVRIRTSKSDPDLNKSRSDTQHWRLVPNSSDDICLFLLDNLTLWIFVFFWLQHTIQRVISLHSRGWHKLLKLPWSYIGFVASN